MNGVFYIGATGLDSQQRALDIVANNIANMNTPAFKQSHAQFSQLMAVDAPSPAGQEPAPPAFMGVQLAATPVDLSQGPMNQTGAPLDVAINGAGFIELMGPGGQSLLWRGGSLMINPDGFLAAANGMPLQAMISVPRDATSLTIGADGKVTVTVADGADPMTIGQIDLVQDIDPTTLTAVSGGLFAPAPDVDLASSAPGVNGAGVLASGFVEGANVDLANEMVTLLLLQRAYSANAQVVQAGDQLMAIANGLKS